MHALIEIVIVCLALILVGSISYLFIKYPLASTPWTFLSGAFMIVIALAGQSLLTPYFSENGSRCLVCFMLGSGLFFCGSSLFLMLLGIHELGLRVWVGAALAAAFGLCSVVFSFFDAMYLCTGIPDLSAFNVKTVATLSSPSESKLKKTSEISTASSNAGQVKYGQSIRK